MNIKDTKEVIQEAQKPLNNHIETLTFLGHQSLSILFFMGLGLLYKHFIGPQIDKIRNSLSRTLDQEKQLLVLMSRIMQFYDADRVLIDAIHNGSSLSNGTHLYKVSTYLEVSNTNFRPIKDSWQSVPVSTLIPYFDILLAKESHSFYAETIINSKFITNTNQPTPFRLSKQKHIQKEEVEIPQVLQEYYALNNIDSIIHILLLKNKEITGIICIHNPRINQKQLSMFVQDINSIYNVKNSFFK
jgi:hypothetical protein